MLLTVFRSRLRPEQAAEYAVVAAPMEELARAMPGFLSIKGFTAADGERVSIVEFADEETQRVWREHPEHREAQRLGREKFYATFRIQVCRIEHAHEFPGGPA